MADPWWSDLGLGTGAHGLTFGGRDLAVLAEAHGTPLFVYSADRLRENVALLRAALGGTGLPWCVHYAMKANRFGGVLRTLRAEGDVGIDACSPREVERALAHGFLAHEISATVYAPSDRDLDAYARAGVHLNVDSRSALRRWGLRVPRGTRVGLRVDPGAVEAYGGNARVAYGGGKFGLLPADLPDFLDVAHAAGLVVDTLHVHLGWGLPLSARDAYEAVLERVAALAATLPDLRTVNVGGGLGTRRRAEDRPLRPEDLVAAWTKHLGPLGVTLACEPGTLLVDSAGVLVARVSTVDEKGGTTWVGIDAGVNLYVYAGHYGLPVEIVHVGRPLDPVTRPVSVAGFINEAIDVFGRDVALPEVREGDLVAIVPAGAYGSSMASDHCLRGAFSEVLIGPE